MIQRVEKNTYNQAGFTFDNIDTEKRERIRSSQYLI